MSFRECMNHQKEMSERWAREYWENEALYVDI